MNIPVIKYGNNITNVFQQLQSISTENLPSNDNGEKKAIPTISKNKASTDVPIQSQFYAAVPQRVQTQNNHRQTVIGQKNQMLVPTPSLPTYANNLGNYSSF